MIDFLFFTRLGLISFILFTGGFLLFLYFFFYRLMYRGFFFRYRRGKPYIKGTISNNIVTSSIFFLAFFLGLCGLLLSFGFRDFYEFDLPEEGAMVEIERLNGNEYLLRMQAPNQSASLQLSGNTWKVQGTVVSWNDSMRHVGLENYHVFTDVISSTGVVKTIRGRQDITILNVLERFKKLLKLYEIKTHVSPQMPLRESSYELMISSGGYMVKRTD